MGVTERRNCPSCYREARDIRSKMYSYNVYCECCIGNYHVEVVDFCEHCKPTPPNSIKIMLNKTHIDE